MAQDIDFFQVKHICHSIMQHFISAVCLIFSKGKKQHFKEIFSPFKYTLFTEETTKRQRAD